MNPLITYIKVESLRAQLAIAERIVEAAVPELAHQDNGQTVALGEALERIAGVRVWLGTWQATIEGEAQVAPPKRKARR